MKILQNEHGNIASSFNYFMKFNLPKKSEILDIGCNYGSLIYNLTNKGYNNVQGIDINKKNLKIGEKEYPKLKNKLLNYNGEKLPFPDKSFDVILMFDVIEHIPKVQEFLKDEVYRVLKDRGIFIFQTPNKLTNIPWMIIRTKSLTKWKKWHCSLQTYRNLEKLLEKSNFKNIKIEKCKIYTEHNKTKIGKVFGKRLAKLILKFLAKLPTSLNSNFWGCGKK